MPDTMTIEEIGAALDDPFAHLAPWATHVDDPERPGELVSALWWAVWTDLEGIGADEPLYAPAGRPEVYGPTRWFDSDGHGHVLAGPTREAALEEATRAIRAGRFATAPELVAWQPMPRARPSRISP